MISYRKKVDGMVSYIDESDRMVMRLEDIWIMMTADERGATISLLLESGMKGMPPMQLTANADDLVELVRDAEII